MENAKCQLISILDSYGRAVCSLRACMQTIQQRSDLKHLGVDRPIVWLVMTLHRYLGHQNIFFFPFPGRIVVSGTSCASAHSLCNSSRSVPWHPIALKEQRELNVSSPLPYSSVSLIGYPNKSLELSSSVLFIAERFKTFNYFWP